MTEQGTTEGKGGDRRRSMLRASMLALAALVLAACGGGSAGQEGEIIGITAQVAMEEAQSGNIEHLAYAGTVVVLMPDVGEVVANCNAECLSDIAEAPDFNVDEIGGGFVATITINVGQAQDALLVEDEAGEWEVTEVLK